MLDHARQITYEGTATYQGVHVNHPSIVSAIRNLLKQGRSTGDIMKVVGMPASVIESIRTEMKKQR